MSASFCNFCISELFSIKLVITEIILSLSKVQGLLINSFKNLSERKLLLLFSSLIKEVLFLKIDSSSFDNNKLFLTFASFKKLGYNCFNATEFSNTESSLSFSSTFFSSS